MTGAKGPSIQSGEEDEGYNISTGGKNGDAVLLVCSHCRTRTNHTVVESVERYWWGNDIQGVDHYMTARCAGCGNFHFCISSSNSEDRDSDGYFVEETRQVPPVNTSYDKPRFSARMPPDVREVYAETYHALCSDLRKLAGTGIRIPVELVCRSAGITDGNLKSKIDRLERQHDITSSMKLLLQALRLFGNDSAHTSITPTSDDLIASWRAVTILLSYLYETNDTTERLWRFNKDNGN